MSKTDRTGLTINIISILLGSSIIASAINAVYSDYINSPNLDITISHGYNWDFDISNLTAVSNLTAAELQENWLKQMLQ